MDEWEAKYKTLAAGITDPTMIANAERVVESAIAPPMTRICRVALLTLEPSQ